MRYYEYSQKQLEQKANELNIAFDKDRLLYPKPIDVYDVVDFIGCTPDWVYLSPTQIYLGMTVYKDGYWWVWPKPYYEEGMIPQKIPVYAGTILIDQTLSDGNDRTRENFTVIHECFHHILHAKCFRNKEANYQHFCEKKAFRAETGKKRPMSAIEIIEYQANYCAAAFLMPEEAIKKLFLEKMKITKIPDKPIKITLSVECIISEMAELFCVNYMPMKYRLQSLNLLSTQQFTIDEYFCI